MKKKEIANLSGLPLKTIRGLIDMGLIDKNIEPEEAEALKENLDSIFECVMGAYPGFERCEAIKDRLIVVNRYGLIIDGLEGKVIKPRVDTDNAKKGRIYSYVSIWTEGKVKNFMVHRLVAEAFCPNFWGKKDVHHKHGRGDNRADSLLFVTKKEHGKISAFERMSKNLRKIFEDCLLRENNGSKDGSVWYTERKEPEMKNETDKELRGSNPGIENDKEFYGITEDGTVLSDEISEIDGNNLVIEID